MKYINKEELKAAMEFLQEGEVYAFDETVTGTITLYNAELILERHPTHTTNSEETAYSKT